MSQSWIFQPNTFWTGWDETGLSIFSGNPSRSLVRELIQNSLDAKVEDADRVKIKFELNSFQRSAVPDIERLTQILQCCVNSSEDESEDSIAEIKEAHDYCSRMNFHVLSCTDFGTTGMAGPYVKGRPFYTYLNTKGSSPGDSNRAGSHGHGKDAPLANSAIRAIFASATYLDEAGEKRHLAQGKCVFMSHFQDDQQFENIGQWSTSSLQPVEELESQHNWINPYPEDLGTTISILGFQGHSKGHDWISEMMGHALINYFPAFVRDALELEFKDGARKVTLNADNFLDFLFSKDIKNALGSVDKELVEELARTAYFVSSMMETRGGICRDQQGLKPLNLVHFNLYVDDEAPRAYCLIRRNMKICESLPNLQRLPAKYSNFAAVIEMQAEETNKLVRSMEPSEHDRVELARLKKKEKREEGEKLWRLLRDKFLSVLDQEALPEQKISGQIDFLAKFFPDLAGEAPSGSEEMQGFDEDRIVFTPSSRRRRRRRVTVVEETPELQDVTEEDPEEEDNPETLSEPADNGPNLHPAEQLRSLSNHITKQRVVDIGADKLRLFAKLDRAQDCYVSVAEVGLDRAENVAIIEASVGEVRGGKLFLSEAQMSESSQICVDVKVERQIVGGFLIDIQALVQA